MVRKLALIIICLLMTASITSCYDAEEIDNQVYVLTIAIDKGEKHTWRLTVQIPTMRDGAGGGMAGGGGAGGGSSQNGYETITIESPSFFAAISMIETFVPRKLNFMHTKFIIFSEELARSGKLGEMIGPIIRYKQIRRSAHVMVARGSARELAENLKPVIGRELSKSQELIMERSQSIGLFPDVTLGNLYSGFKSTYRQPVMALIGINNFKGFEENGNDQVNEMGTEVKYFAGELPRTGGSKIELLGAAVLDGDTMVGELDAEDTRLMLIGRGELERSFIAIRDPKKPENVVPIDVRTASKPKVKVITNGDRPSVSLELFLEGEILAVQSRIDYESLELKPVLEESFKKYIHDGMLELVKKSQEMQADILQFGRTAVRSFLTIQEWEDYFWIKRYQDAEVQVKVNFTITRTGTMLRSTPVLRVEGKE